MRNKIIYLFVVSVMFASNTIFFPTAQADEPARTGIFKKIIMQKMMDKRADNGTAQVESSKQGLNILGAGTAETRKIGARDFIVYTPPSLPPEGARPLLVALHGGFGNGSQIRGYLGIEPYADKYGFMVAYPSGTAVSRALSDNRAGWNGGECCGQPSETNVDDVGFITSVVDTLAANDGVDKKQVYGTGHSNGAIMTYRLLCETDLYRAAVPLSGTLELDVDSCPAAKNKPILAIHGENDQNLPVAGGHTTTGINARTNYRSQEYTRRVFMKSGAAYQLVILPGAEHRPETLNAALLKTENMTLPQTIVHFLGLDSKK